jgi:hypothetical protein
MFGARRCDEDEDREARRTRRWQPRRGSSRSSRFVRFASVGGFVFQTSLHVTRNEDEA